MKSFMESLKPVKQKANIICKKIIEQSVIRVKNNNKKI